MEKILNLLSELSIENKSKSVFAKTQKYEDAAKARDRERNIEVKICKLINKHKSNHSYIDCNSSLRDYLLEEYQIEYKYPGDILQIRREILLKQIGI